MEEIHRESLEEAATHTTDEARMILPGVQAIMGFQLVAVFNQRFETLENTDQFLHLGAFFLISLSMGLLMTPAAYHRLAARRRVSRHFVSLSSRLITVGLVPLLIGLAIDAYILVLLVSHEKTAAIAAAMVVATVLLGLWFGLPIVQRRKDEPSDR